MEIFGNILDWAVAFFLFGLLLFIHELGHFLMCRLTGVKAEEFGFGFPPRLVKLFTWQGTDITLNWIPFGAFVRPLGEDDPTVAGGLAAASKRVRTLVLLGGVLFNAVAAITAYTIAFKIAYPDSVAVYSVTPDTPSAQSGLLPGDVILSVDGHSRQPLQRIDGLHLRQSGEGSHAPCLPERDGARHPGHPAHGGGYAGEARARPE